MRVVTFPFTLALVMADTRRPHEGFGERMLVDDLAALREEDNIFFQTTMSMPLAAPVPPQGSTPGPSQPPAGTVQSQPPTSIHPASPSGSSATNEPSVNRPAEAPVLTPSVSGAPVVSFDDDVTTSTVVPTPTRTPVVGSDGERPEATPTEARPIFNAGQNEFPTAEPMAASAQPSMNPTANPTPSAFLEAMIFECSSNGVDQALPPHEGVTILDFTVGYAIETSQPIESFQEDLEKAILGSALSGALECVQGSPFFAPFDGREPPVALNTTMGEALCFAEVDLRNDCIVFETTFQVAVAADLDPEAGRFLGYVRLQEDMDGIEYLDTFPLIDRFQYVSPLPLLPPFTGPEQSGAPNELRATNSALSVTPWTVSAVLAMCVGGVIALWVWARNRRTRNGRHLHLLDESSYVSPDSSP